MTDNEILWVIENEDKLMCMLCDAKIWDSDWSDQETLDSWDVGTTIRHVVYWINEHFKEKHSGVFNKK